MPRGGSQWSRWVREVGNRNQKLIGQLTGSVEARFLHVHWGSCHGARIMPGRYRDLTVREKEAVRPLLHTPSPTRPYADPAVIFNTLLYVLWEQKPIRGSHGEGYSHSSRLCPAIWRWTESGQLKTAWRAYLRLQNETKLGQWAKLFEFYRDSWQDRKEATKHATKVHSSWFRIMNDALAMEQRRRRKAEKA